MVEYKNRYDDVFTFELNERGNIDWKGDFKYVRCAFGDNPEDITMVDPSGGPYIKQHMNLGNFFGDEFNELCVSSLTWNKDKKAYEIQTYGEFDHLADSKRIGGLSV